MIDNSAPRLPHRWIFLPLLLTLILSSVVAGIGWFWYQVHTPYYSGNPNEEILTVKPGMTGTRISQILEERKIIRSKNLFLVYLRILGGSDRIKAGEYLFEYPLSLAQVAEKLILGKIYYHRITIPEGLDRIETGQRFVQMGFGSREGFSQATSKADLIHSLDPEAIDLEGYLFPETYFLTRGMHETEIIEFMVSKHLEAWSRERRQKARRLGMSVREVITLASMIEKETALDSERRLVSAVFHNRIDRGMKLACDPTVVFAVKQIQPYDGIIHQSDLQLDSPYNTYLYPGLPPGPIASPGLQSIDAALNPAPSDYLYFVSKNDGSHHFSRSYREHSIAVQRYQR